MSSVSFGIALNTTAELGIPAKLAGQGGTVLDSIRRGVQVRTLRLFQTTARAHDTRPFSMLTPP